ncbi:MAG: hypothetical protein AAF732_13495 [Pseudomonadota bacterium]
MKNAISWLLILASVGCLVASWMTGANDQTAWILTLCAVAAFIAALVLQQAAK